MEEDTKIQQGMTGRVGVRTLRETFRSGTPEEVREKAKETVEKAVAVVAGALRGLADTRGARELRESVCVGRDAVASEGRDREPPSMGMGGSSLESGAGADRPDR